MDISVIMPCYLGPYEGAASDRPYKLHRAVCSFLTATDTLTRELVIVSDGCDETDLYWKKLAKHYGSEGDEARFNDRVTMRHVRIDKQPPWSGEVRNAGLDVAKGRIVCYLDADDKALPWHFGFIAENFGQSDWVWFDDLIWPEQLRVRELKVEHIGTGCFAHLRALGLRWSGGYCYDWAYLERLIEKTSNHKYIGHGGYVVCHIPHKLDV